MIYNDSCPICSREVGLYKREAESADLPIAFSGLSNSELEGTGLSRDQAAREFHVILDGERLAGLDAFLALWNELPKWRWLASVLDKPVIRPCASFVYSYIAAPALYSLHKRRQHRMAQRAP